jgi:uncharacterized DUF497 family protein
MFVFDLVKDRSNQAKHGVSLAEAHAFEWDAALIREDRRHDYGELRFDALGYIGPRLFVMVFCLRGDDIRIISLRKANQREVARYART